MSKIIPAASNALMIKRLENHGFEDVYLDNFLLGLQLLGEEDVRLLPTREYLKYVNAMTKISDINFFADAHVDAQQSMAVPAIIAALEKMGIQEIIANDSDNLENIDGFTTRLAAMENSKQADTHILINLAGYEAYGLSGLARRISIAETFGFEDIVISQITNDDIPAIQDLQIDTPLSVIIDNPNICASFAEQVDAKYVFDSYNICQGLRRSAETISQNMIIKMFMGN